MAHDGMMAGDEPATDAPPQGDGIAYLKRFGRLVERGRTVLDAGCGDGLPVDAYLVKHGLAVNGIDASARLVARARKNVPEGFYEIKDLYELTEGEYCVDGVVSLRALLQTPYEHYRALFTTFASFMPNGGALLLRMRLDEPGQAGETAHGANASRQAGAGDSTELLEDAGFTIILKESGGPGAKTHQIILARS
jgi:trans-aconitate methyltransferase